MTQKKKDSELFDLMDVLGIIAHYLPIILIVTVIFGISGFVFSKHVLQPKYTASSYIYVNNNTNTIANQSYSTTSELTASKMLADTYTVIAKMNSVLGAAQEAAGTDYSYDKLAGMVSVDSVEQTGVLKISVTADNAVDAMLLANGMINAIPDVAKSIIAGSDTRVMQEAELPLATMPNTFKITLLCALAGAVITALIFVLLEMFNDKIMDSEYLQNNYNIPILAIIPDLFETDSKKRSEKKKKSAHSKVPAEYYLEERPFICDKMNFGASEGYKMLRTGITTALGTATGGKAIGITSPNNNEGKSLCSINTAYTFALLDKALLLEGDLRIPTAAKRLSINRTPGFTELIRGQHTIEDVIQRTKDTKDLDIITSGNRPSNPAEILASDAAQNAFSILNSHYSYIVMDLPPVNELSDTIIAGRMLDGVILVVNEGETSKAGLAAAIRRLEQSNTTILGFVMVNAVNSMYENNGYGKYGKYKKYSHYSSYGRYSRYDRYSRYGKYDKYGKYGRYSQSEKIAEEIEKADISAEDILVK